MDLRSLPIQPDHTCFACGHNNETGLKMEFWTDGEVVYSRLAVPNHMSGWRGTAHGGIAVTILDEVMANAAIYLLERIAMTRSIQAEFLRPVPVDRSLEARAWLVQRPDEHVAILQSEIIDAEGQRCVAAQAEYSLLDIERFRHLDMPERERVVQTFERFLELCGKGQPQA